MQEILRIQGQLVDIIPNTISRTIQINDLGSAESRESSYSQTVKLPKTSRNQKVMGFLGVSGNTSTVPYTQLACDYTVDGVPLIIGGYAEVKATGSYYEVVIYDGVIDLAEKLKGKTLSTLDYSDLNHYLSSANYIDSLTNTEGYIYALGRFMDNGLGTLKIERQVPSVYTHTLWDKVFSQLGMTYRGSFFVDNEDFKSEVVAPPQGYEVQDVAQTITPMGTYTTDTVSHFERSQDYIWGADEYFAHNTTFADSNFNFLPSGIISINNDISLNMVVSVDYNSIEGYNRFHVLLNGKTTKSILLQESGNTLSFDLNLSLNAGDELSFKVSGSDTGYGDETVEGGGGEKLITDEGYSVNYSASASIIFSEATGGFLVDFSKMMGKLPQIDFIKDVMQRYGLVIRPVRGSTNNYEFIQFEELLNDRDNAEDWTDKLNDITGEKYGISYAKENIASYSYHEDIIVPTQDGVLTINNENANAKKDLFKSPYQIPTKGVSFYGVPMYLHPVWESKDEDGVEVIEVKESPIKTFRIKKVNGSMSVYYFNDANAVTFTGERPFLSLENMGMQYFINVYYKAYKLAINTYKEVDTGLYLNLLDVYNLDLFKLKYLKQTGKYYYLNEVKHNAGGKVSSGKLIEINDFSTNAPVQTLGTYSYNMNYDTTRTLSTTYLTTSTTPAYYDPENDAALAVKFISGFNSDIKLYQNGVEIIDDTEILISNWNVTVVDMGNTTDIHTASFDYMIKDAGSDSYGTEVGTFNVNVSENVNYAPTANAGANRNVEIIDGEPSSTFAQLDGSGSYDNTGTITYLWSITSAPPSHTCTINQPTSDVGYLDIPQDAINTGTYTLRITVTDEFGLSDFDEMTVQVSQDFKELQ